MMSHCQARTARGTWNATSARLALAGKQAKDAAAITLKHLRDLTALIEAGI